jgi:predicted ArsR family transcriptional regulator
MNLFEFAEAYPQSPGFKARETSRAAAESVSNAACVRGKVLRAIRRLGDATADEVAAHLNIDRLTVRPRCSELSAMGKIIDSGVRRKNGSGRNAIAWVVTN